VKPTHESSSSSTASKAETPSAKKDRQLLQVEEFLKHLGEISPISRRISPSLTATEITGPNTNCLHAKDRRCVLLSWDERETSLPISVFFLTRGEKQNFGHASLLTNSTKNNAQLMGRIAEATQNLFSGNPSDLLSSLCPQWLHEDFGGMIDKRMLWSTVIDCVPVIDLLAQESKAALELPVLPSVFTFNNPYLNELIEATHGSVSKDTKILSMGCGAGLEMSYFALKHGMKVDGVDINPLAVLNSKMLARDLGTDHLVRVWASDGFNQVDEAYDLIFLNAPLAMNENRENDPNRFDPQGEFLLGILNGLENHLTPGGRLILMSHQNLDSYISRATTPLEYRNLKTFELKISLAISEIMLRI